ncbi:MAG: DUF5107 domain-containing protein [Lachnospiraceae bacterium]|nr:DUF5107 domain-containing protein [Lachnospiraceae bacterium]
MERVKVWSKEVTIPTYEIGEYSKLPMFLEKRVYQGSSGRVYPHPVCESISDEKTDKAYRAVFLENEYLLVMVLPEIGGRIQRILDKTNQYDAVYYNEVIKPALVGLAGPWISGGIEFNWPQHHRPSTFDPVDYSFQENEDGSATILVGETEKMYRTKGMAAYTLYPGKAYLEIKGQLYNGTDRSQTFLWWANPAVAVNDDTQSVFPPDVHAVMDHGKRDVTGFPISTGTYYKVDYSAGVDISRYKNIPVPTSYMAYHSDYDFVGNYDHGKRAGLLHVADHHISPGKKQWTWGNGDFGRAWDRNLTDENGPYIELMTGVFTDNQPDFTFIAPYEEKTFTQYFMPYKEVGAVKCASRDVMVNLEAESGVTRKAASENTAAWNDAAGDDKGKDGASGEGKAKVGVYTTAAGRYIIRLADRTGRILWETEAEISPKKPYVADDISIETEEGGMTLSVYDCDGRILLSYTKPGEAEAKEPLPDPALPCEKPKDIETMEERYLTGLHLEQYRHATYRPEDYYREGLKRDPTDIRINNAYGRLLYNRGKFRKAEKHFQAAIAKATWKNPNPYDCEPYYNLGLALKKQGKYEAAYDAFYKAIWDGSMQDKGFYQLAALAAGKEDWAAAREFVETSLLRGTHNIKARNLKTVILRLTGKADEARALAAETQAIDPLDHGSLYELLRLAEDVHLEQGADMQEATPGVKGLFGVLKKDIAVNGPESAAQEDVLQASETQEWQSLAAQFQTLLRDDVDSYLELAIDYGEWGLYEEAVRVLQLYMESAGAACKARTADSPMVHYYLAYYLHESGRSVNERMKKSATAAENVIAEPEAIVEDVKSELAAAAHCACDYCFPVRLHDILALSFAIEQNPADASAHYLLGNLYYDKGRWKKALALWQEAEALDSENAIVHRNLALLYFNKKKDPKLAQGQMQKALAAAPDDARIFFEADQLDRQMNRPFLERLKNMEKHRALLISRDDLYTEYITLLNCAGEYEKALDAMLTHRFHPWEGGEGKIPAQYKAARIGLAQQKMAANDYEGAIDCLNRALTYPENFGEGKLAGTMDNDVYYFLGKAYEPTEPVQAKEMYRLALRGGDDLSSAQYYNDQPPEMFYYRALATAALGEEKAALRMLDNLFAYGVVHLRDKAEIDYFAVSLPDFLIFETDLKRKNRVNCAFLAALGSFGLKEYENADYFVKEGLSRDNAHQGLLRLRQEMESLPN